MSRSKLWDLDAKICGFWKMKYIWTGWKFDFVFVSMNKMSRRDRVIDAIKRLKIKYWFCEFSEFFLRKNYNFPSLTNDFWRNKYQHVSPS